MLNLSWLLNCTQNIKANFLAWPKIHLHQPVSDTATNSLNQPSMLRDFYIHDAILASNSSPCYHSNLFLANSNSYRCQSRCYHLWESFLCKSPPLSKFTLSFVLLSLIQYSPYATNICERPCLPKQTISNQWIWVIIV